VLLGLDASPSHRRAAGNYSGGIIMDPVTALFLVAGFVAAKGGEAIAAEAGKDLYNRTRSWWVALIHRDDSQASPFSDIESLEKGDIANPGLIRLEGVVRRDPILMGQLEKLQKEIAAVSSTVEVRQWVEGGQQITGVRAPSMSDKDISVSQFLKDVDGAIGVELT
jgi:hypothetical protein